MAGAKNHIEVQKAAFEWLQIASGVAQGLLAPEEGVSGLQALAEAFPADRDWLQEEIETIRRQFGLDVAARICDGQDSYWAKVRSLVDALLDDRMDYDRALTLLRTIDAQHPEHAEQTATLIDGIENSPLYQCLMMDD